MQVGEARNQSDSELKVVQERLEEIEATTPTKADIHAEMLSAIEGLKLPSAAQFERLQRIPASLITAAQLFQLQL